MRQRRLVTRVPDRYAAAEATIRLFKHVFADDFDAACRFYYHDACHCLMLAISAMAATLRLLGMVASAATLLYEFASVTRHFDATAAALLLPAAFHLHPILPSILIFSDFHAHFRHAAAADYLLDIRQRFAADADVRYADTDTS